MTIVKATSADIGCYVEGWWGQYAGAHMIHRAIEFGYSDAEAIELADRHIGSMGPSTEESDPLVDTEHELLTEAAEDAAIWLNEHVAPQDHYFGWLDGEFFLQSVDWWDEQS